MKLYKIIIQELFIDILYSTPKGDTDVKKNKCHLLYVFL